MVILYQTIGFSWAQQSHESDSLADLGYSYYEEGLYEEAVEAFSGALELNIDAESYYLRGVCYSQLGLNDQAIADYNQALVLMPDYAEVYYEKGYSYFLLSQYDSALSAFDRAIGLNAQYAAAYVNRGSIYCILGKRQQAIEDWNTAEGLGAQVPLLECD